MALLMDMDLNQRHYEIYYFTGSVVDEKQWAETEVSGSGGGGYSVGGQTTPVHMAVRSKTTRHNQVMLQDKDGHEKSFTFEDWDISCRKGNILTVLWAIPKGQKRGPYILVYNHAMKQFFWGDDFARMFLPGRVTLPLRGNSSWWPVAAFFATPLVWSLFWPQGGMFALGLFIMPFVAFFAGRSLVRRMAQRKAAAYLDGDPDKLNHAIDETRAEAALLEG